MSIFKSIKLFCGLVAVAGLVGCTSPDENKPQAGDGSVNANFIQSAAVTFETSVSRNTFDQTSAQNALYKAWDFPSQRTYTFSVCLNDKKTNQAIISEQSFAVEVDRKQMIESVTERDGCIRWEENIDYNFKGFSEGFRVWSFGGA